MLEILETQDGPLFYFFAPLVKGAGKEKDGDRIIEGVAATPDRDAHGETVRMDGLDVSYLFRFGKINWEHRKEPGYIIGKPLNGDITPERFKLRSKLFKGMPIADQAWSLLQATSDDDEPALGYSVEGKVLERNPRNPTDVIRAMVVNVALTANPVNANTYADVVKSFGGGGFSKSLTLASAAPLIRESLEGLHDPDYMRVLEKHMEITGCRCVAADGRFVNDYPGALAHFHDCLGAPLVMAADLAKHHRLIAEQYATRRRA
jgi:hypothetical protein